MVPYHPLEPARNPALLTRMGIVANSVLAPACWTPAVFQDKAEELHRRLSVWHIDDNLCPACPTLQQAESWVNLTFRDVVRNMTREPNSRQSLDNATNFRPGLHNKTLTQTRLVDFYEHLPDAGESQIAEYLCLKFSRILDMQIYHWTWPTFATRSSSVDSRVRRKAMPKTEQRVLIVGRELDQLELQAFVDAASKISVSQPRSPINDPDPDPEDAEYDSLSDTQKSFLQALLELKAFNSDSSRTLQCIVQHAIGPNEDPDNFKRAAARLRELALTKGRTGPKGGSWLTEKGRRFALKVKERNN